MILLLATLADNVGLLLLLPILQGIMQNTPPQQLDRFLLPLGLPTGWWAITIAFACMLIIRAWLTHLRETLSNQVRGNFVTYQRLALTQALLNAEWRFSSRLDHAQLQNLWSNDLTRLNQGTAHALQAITSLLMLTGWLLLAGWISLKLTMIALLILALAGWSMRHQLRHTHTLGLGLSSAAQQNQRIFSNLLGGLKIYKAFAVEQNQQQSCFIQANTLNDEQICFIRQQSLWRKIAELAGLASVGLVFFIGWHQLQLAPAAILLFVFMMMRIAGTANQLQQSTQLFWHMLPAFAQLKNTLSSINAAVEPSATIINLQHPHQLSLVQISIGAGSKTVLDKLTLTLRSTETLAITGPSGSGKSTLTEVLMGLIIPDQGLFLADGVPLTGAKRQAWRQHVAYVPQDAMVQTGTIRSNLLLAKADASDKELWDALEQASAADFVKQRPQQLDSAIGEQGMLLSGGERQRLALARALLRTPWLLVLDEVSSQLDFENELRTANTIRRLHGKMLIIIVAHRPALLAVADRIVQLENGKLTHFTYQSAQQ